MPELPEVETIRRGLEKYLVRKKIADVEVRLPRIVAGSTQDVVGGKVVAVKRAGKGLIIDLDNGYSIAVHIKLTGQLIYQGPGVLRSDTLSSKVGGALPNKWTHVIFKLKAQNSKVKTADAYLFYNDLRQFGWLKIIPTRQVGELPFFKELGPEPPVVGGSRVLAKASVRSMAFYARSVSPSTLSLEVFKNIVSKSPTKIKPLLMDQKKIGGLGNIYANDALWLAGIDPRRPAKSLSLSEQRKLYETILEVLRRGLKYGGASELSYVNALGREGTYQRHFLAYAQNGEPCQRCHSIIKKVFLGGRGTYFCTMCQK